MVVVEDVVDRMHGERDLTQPEQQQPGQECFQKMGVQGIQAYGSCRLA